MEKIFFILFFVFICSPSTATAFADKTINLDVPFTSEIPDGKWTPPWNNACEEASIIMVANYYAGNEEITIKQAKQEMSRLFGIENKIYGSNADTNATLTAKLINDYTHFTATIIVNPTLAEIKAELEAGRPVISLHYGKNLPNPEHRWRAAGSYYHMLVITGFDDVNKEFLVNDSAAHKHGLDYRYKYDTIMDTLADFNHQTKTTDGEPTVIFTRSKMLAKSTNSKKIYLISHNIKQHVTNSEIFKANGWKWSTVQILNKQKIDSFINGEPIKK